MEWAAQVDCTNLGFDEVVEMLQQSPQDTLIEYFSANDGAGVQILSQELLVHTTSVGMGNQLDLTNVV